MVNVPEIWSTYQKYEMHIFTKISHFDQFFYNFYRNDYIISVLYLRICDDAKETKDLHRQLAALESTSLRPPY